MSASFYDLMKYAHTGLATADMTAYDKMRAVAMAGGGTIKTLTGVPPLTFKANGKPLISWSMLGNSQQNGTPAPDAPIMPTFCGERTENLFDINSTATTSNCSISVSDNVLTQVSSGIYARSAWKVNNLVIGSAYTVSITANNPNSCSFRMNVMDSTNSTVIASSSAFTDSRSISIVFTATQTTHVLRIYSNTLDTSSTSSITFSNIMINAGSTPLTYDPYGWKIPVTSAGQTQNVYLGQVQTVRRIRKLVLTGDETDWAMGSSSSNTKRFVLAVDALQSNIDIPTSVCSHFELVANGMTYVANFCYTIDISGGISKLYISMDNTYTSISTFTNWLKSQYAAGTPVVIWYVLANEQTGIVNEPLAKIGTYADELHSADAGVSIPTARGQNTLTVDTDLQPSSMTIKYR